MRLDLDQCGGLYYCLTDVFIDDRSPMESEVWLLRLGSPRVHQLDALPGNVTNIPSVRKIIRGTTVDEEYLH